MACYTIVSVFPVYLFISDNQPEINLVEKFWIQGHKVVECGHCVVVLVQRFAGCMVEGVEAEAKITLFMRTMVFAIV